MHERSDTKTDFTGSRYSRVCRRGADWFESHLLDYATLPHRDPKINVLAGIQLGGSCHDCNSNLV